MIELIRYAVLPDRTLGRMTYEDASYWTIECPWLDNQPNISCIPAGRYGMVRVNSPRYGENSWEIAEVPDRSHVLIHAGNWARNFKGCIGLGRGVFKDLEGVSNSSNAVQEFYRKTDGMTELEIDIKVGAIR